MDPGLLVENMIGANKWALVDWFRKMSDSNFEIWYVASLTLRDACEQHIKNEGLEHLWDKYDR